MSRKGESCWMSLVPSEKRLRSHALSSSGFSFLHVFLEHVGSVGNSGCDRNTAKSKAMSLKDQKAKPAPTCDVLHVLPLPPCLYLAPCKALSRVSQPAGVRTDGSQTSLVSFAQLRNPGWDGPSEFAPSKDMQLPWKMYFKTKTFCIFWPKSAAFVACRTHLGSNSFLKVGTVFWKMYLNRYLEKVRDSKNAFLKVFIYKIKAFHTEFNKLVL